ncbi:MAG: hypothetical protein MUO40_08905, partial [Anaerolineaceae bacterium]|nr:hypothetical protein [Anaerolineaceae bacterium]
VKKAVIILIVILFFTYVGTELSCGSWIYTYSLKSNLTNEITSAYLTSAFWGALTIGRLVGVVLSKLIKPEKFLIIDFSGSFVSLLIIIIWSNSITGLWIGTLLFGLFMASVFPMLLVFAERRYQITGAMAGWFFVGSSSGGIVFPFVISQLFNHFGPKSIPMTWLISIILSIIILSFMLLISAKFTQNNHQKTQRRI